MKYEKIEPDQHEAWGRKLKEAQTLTREVIANFPKTHPQARAAHQLSDSLDRLKTLLERRMLEDYPDTDWNQAKNVYYGANSGEAQ